MKSKIIVTDNRELQRKQFKIPENLNFGLQRYAEKIDATENSIIIGLLEDFLNEVNFGSMIYNNVNSLSYFKKKLMIISPAEHLGFNSEGNSLTLEKRLNIEAIKTSFTKSIQRYSVKPEQDTADGTPIKKSYISSSTHSFRAEQHTKIIEHDSEFKVIKTETTSFLGIFNTFEELLTYFKVDSSWSYQMTSTTETTPENEEV